MQGHQGPGPAIAPALVTEAELPDGYREDAAHHMTMSEDGAPQVPASCAPIAQIIGAFPSIRQDEHPEATRSFGKGHYGPSITETIIDYGDKAAASKALSRLDAASENCDRYAQSSSPIGANRYTVKPSENEEQASTALRLNANGSDFRRGINWDIWAIQDGGRLVAVTFRSALGGDNDDLYEAFPAAISALGEA